MNEQKGSSVEEFFKGLPTEDKREQDIFDEKKKEEPKTEEAPEKEVDPEEVPDSLKNRQHRRLEQKLQKERESNIALAERVKILSESDRFAEESKIDPRIAKMFDTSDVGKENALRLHEVMQDMSARAKQEALEEIQNQQVKEREEQKSYEGFIDNELESIEDQYNIDLTSDAPKARKARREFLELVQSLSPKDEDGTITGYADFGSTFEVYQQTHTEKVDNSRQKELASKLMQKSGNSETPTPQITSGFRGWEKDMNINN